LNADNSQSQKSVHPQSQKSAPGTQNNVQDITFVKQLLAYYNQKLPGQQGGKKTYRRKINPELSAFKPKNNRTNHEVNSDLLSESGDNDSFYSCNNRIKLLNQFTLADGQSRIKVDPKVTEAYNAILKRIMEMFEVDEDEGRLYRSVLKITVTREHPELRKRENDALKIKEIEKLLDDKKKVSKLLNDKDYIKSVQKHMEEQKKQSDIRRAEFLANKKNGKTATSSEGKEEEKKTEKKEKKEKKSPKKKSKVVDGGYIKSDEILLSP